MHKGHGFGRALVGLALIVVGVGIILDRFGVAIFPGWSFGQLWATFWPLILVAIGVKMLFYHHYFPGLLVFVVGIAFELQKFTAFGFWSIFWPLFLIGFGFLILAKPKKYHREEKWSGKSQISTEDEISESVNFQGLEKKITSQNWKGGEINCSFGGVKLDLREAKLDQSGAELKISCSLGGVEIMVPENMRVEAKGSALLGGWDEKFRGSKDENAPLLKITGNVFLGGVSIKS